MTTLAQIKEGLSDIWDNIATGWNELRDGAAAAITRYNPVHKTDDNEKERALYKQTARWGLLAAEIAETKDSLIVNIEAPGMEADEFDITVIDNELRIRGEKQFHNQYKSERMHITECAYGRFQRVIPLPVSVTEDKARAKYKRGVLSITLAKAKSAHARKIKIES